MSPQKRFQKRVAIFLDDIAHLPYNVYDFGRNNYEVVIVPSDGTLFHVVFVDYVVDYCKKGWFKFRFECYPVFHCVLSNADPKK